MGLTPRVLSLPPGHHTLTLTRGARTHTRQVSVVAGRTLTIDHDFAD